MLLTGDEQGGVDFGGGLLAPPSGGGTNEGIFFAKLDPSGNYVWSTGFGAVDAALDWPNLAIGLLTIVLILLLERTPVGALGLVVAVVLSSAVVTVLGLATVKTLSDIAAIPSTLPHPTVPDLALVPGLLLPALSLALVGLVQGAAISSSMPNPAGATRTPQGTSAVRASPTSRPVSSRACPWLDPCRPPRW